MKEPNDDIYLYYNRIGAQSAQTPSPFPLTPHKQTMEKAASDTMGNTIATATATTTTTATISPANCDLKQMTASKLKRNGNAVPDCDLKRRKSNLYQPQSNMSRFSNSSMIGTGGDGDSDCTSTPPSPSKKPLHLQIIEDSTCSSSGNENESAHPSHSQQHSSPSDNFFLHGKDGTTKRIIPLSSERDVLRESETAISDNIIIHSSPSTSAFVPLGDELKRESRANSTFDGGGPKPKLNTTIISCNDIHQSTTGDGGGHSDNSNNIKVKLQSNLNSSNLHNDVKIDRHNHSESSTPDLASTLPCVNGGNPKNNKDISAINGKGLIISSPNTNSTSIRAVSVTCSEINSEVEQGKNHTLSNLCTSSQSTTTSKTQTENPQQLQSENQSANVASALDQVLAELEENGMKRKKEKPCILQQSLVGDSGSSGTSTPNEDILNDAKKDGDSDDKAHSLQVQSSMLLPEDSLNVIAQMTVSSGSKKEKENVVTFKDDIVDKNVDKNDDNDDKTKDSYSGSKIASTLPCKDSCKINADNTQKRPPLSEAIKMEIVHPIVPSPSNDKFESQQIEQTPKAAKGPPLISGTASAQLKIMSGKSTGDSNHKSQPKSPLANEKMNPVEKTEPDDGDVGNVWEKGMSMLADIISNATPMKVKRSRSQSEADGDGSNSMIAPVGQSLRLYTSIAAQAGISSYTPAKIGTDSAMTSTDQSSNLQPVMEPVNECETNFVPLQEPMAEPQHYIREIGKIRRYDASMGAFSEWENLPFQTYGDSEPRRWCELNIDESIEIPLRRGGRLRVFPNFLGETRRASVKFAMDHCRLFRQYNVIEENQSFLESRLQVLLSSQEKKESMKNELGVGYVYQGVSMRAKPLSEEPQIEKLHNDLAELYRLPNKQWNIGANLLYYRDGEDHTTWHSDDTQGEALILCIVVDSQSHARPILVKPKTEAGFKDGDEEIIIFVGQGDAYEMDGQMQLNYEHCLPMKQDDLEAKRTAIIFRHGSTVPVSLDTGIPLVSEDKKDENLPNAKDLEHNSTSSHFGHVGEIREGKKLYTKDTLKRLGAHRQDKKIICGGVRDGCESILVETQNRALREDDGLCWFQISCNKANGGVALCQSYHKKTCIRVFRSSELENKYAPILYEGEEDILYRYDGLYTVRAMWDPEGSETEKPPSSEEMHTYFLMRQPKRPADGNIEDRMNYNKISLQELWNEIQKRKGVKKTKEFAVPEPIMDVGRIGGVRRRIASSRRVLKNEENNEKHHVKRKNVNVVPLQNYSAHPGNGSAFHHRAIYSSDSDSCDESDDETNSVKSTKPQEPVQNYHENGRPRRKSAAVARTYLKEVMHNRYGDMEANETPQKSNTVHSKKRSIWSADGKSEKEEKGRRKGNPKRHRKDELRHSSSDESVIDSIPGEELHFSEKQGNSVDAKCDDDNLEKKGEVVDETVGEIEKSSSEMKGQEDGTVQKDKINVYASGEDVHLDSSHGMETVAEGENDTPLPEEDSVRDKVEPAKPENIFVGSRVNVEYRNTLFKATVRRNRLKAGKHEYSIHYDGNKKSNVHWIPLSMIHEVLDEEPVDVSPEAKPKRGRKRKSIRVKPMQNDTEENTHAVKIEPKQEFFNFAVGSEVYVNYKSVLYLSIVLDAKKNKKGNSEYLVHYDGFKKTADRWIKESALYEVNEETTRRFNEQRGLQSTNQLSPLDMKKLSKKLEVDEALEDGTKDEIVTRSSTEHPSKFREEDDNHRVTEHLDMGDLDSGVEFLPGSCVFVVKANALYLAKMVKRRKKGRGKEYLVQFDGMSAKFNEWISLSSIYELNPKTRKIYERTAHLRKQPIEEDGDEDEESELENDLEKPKKEQPKVVAKSVKVSPKPKATVTPKASARISRRGGGKGRAKKPKASQLYDMQNIEPGVEFLPGSTLFVQWRNGLYLGKMLKKRGKGDHMEYLIHYDGYKSSQDEWVSVSMVFEINPQTKRAFNKQKKT